MNTNEMFDLFIVAMRNAYTFPYKGNCTIQDLFDLSLSALNSIYKNLKAELSKYNTEESLFDDVVTNDQQIVTMLENKLTIVRFVANLLKTEAQQRKQMADKLSHNSAIDQLIAAKKAQQMSEMSIEELEALKL